MAVLLVWWPLSCDLVGGTYDELLAATSRNVRFAGRPYAWATHRGTRIIDWAGGNAARYEPGLRPYTRRKLAVNDPRLDHPTAKQISVTLRSVVRSRAAARSSRRVNRYWCGVSPNVRRNSRLKCAGDRCAARARSATVNGSK